jgi:hypothetical protein
MATATSETTWGTDGFTYPRLLLVLVVQPLIRRSLQRLIRRSRTRGDIIDVWSRIVLEIIDGVDATARAFLDWTTRLVILLRALLVAQTTRRCGWTEVRAAIASASSWRSAGTGPRAEPSSAAGPRSAEAATTAEATATGSRTAEAAATRSRTTEARARRPRRSIFPRTCFADGERPALKRLCVELANDFFRLVTIHEFHERESARTAGLTIDRHGNMRRLCDSREVSAEIRFARAVRKVPDEQTDCQGLLVNRLLSGGGFDSISKTGEKSQRSIGIW